MKSMVATCQFPVSEDIRRNARHILRQLAVAKDAGATVAHFPECGLSGYAGTDFASHAKFEWELLADCARTVLERAGSLGIWAIVGSAHRLTGSHKPHNSVYIVNDRGQLVDRYDKLFCGGNREGTSGDLAHYSPGNHFSVFEIGGLRCGVQVCHDYRYPELYREYKRRGVQLMFHSFHAGHMKRSTTRAIRSAIGRAYLKYNHGTTYPEITMPASMQAAAASSHIWISCSNTSARESCFPAFFVRADGIITGKLRRNTGGVLLSTVDTQAAIYESTAAWRGNALKGVYHSGKIVKDRRSDERTKL